MGYDTHDRQLGGIRHAVGARDYPVVMATTAIFAVLVVVGNLLAALLYAVADLRIREGQR